MGSYRSFPPVTPISYHYAIIDKLVPNVLEIVESTFVAQNFNNATIEIKSYATTNVAHATINWQFSWFRHITPLSHKHQKQIVDRIIANYPKVKLGAK